MVQCFSMGKSTRPEIKNNGTPGPGQYAPSATDKTKYPTWKIGTSQRGPLQSSNTPGPGQYNNHVNFNNRPQSSKYSFGGKNLIKKFNEDPGPGTYDQTTKKTFKQPPVFSFGNKYIPGKKEETPGPSNYYPENYNPIKQRPTSKIGSSQRKHYNDSDAPGPGNYNNSNYMGTTYSFGFGKALRDQQGIINLKNDVPGPGTYQIKTAQQQNGKTLISRKPDITQRNNGVPGPGTYNPDKLFSVKKTRIGSALRSTWQNNQVPGPGQYGLNWSNRPSSAQYKMGTGQRQVLSDLMSETPGPGTYTAQNFNLIKKQPPAYKLKGKYQFKDDNCSPGPAQYYPGVGYIKDNSSKCLIGTSIRKQLNANSNPGPGTYQFLSSTLYPVWKFGTSTRENFNKFQDTPGPGQYTLPKVFADVPKYSMPNQEEF